MEAFNACVVIFNPFRPAHVDEVRERSSLFVEPRDGMSSLGYPYIYE